MKKILASLVFAVFGLALLSARDEAPRKIPLPENYREWVYLSSGLGMSYTANAKPDDDPDFDNVFTEPAAYAEFKKTGTWPDKTMLILEVRKAQSHSSINTSGHFQSDVEGIEAHVKDQRMAGKWAFYSFGTGKSGTLIPTSASCYSCHEQHGVVDTTFVQFYPTLLKIAQDKGTVENKR
jgi:hypothetical protein